MTPQETQFVKTLVDSGVISFKEAGHLEHAQEQVKEETGEHKPVWDIAVEEGIVTSVQAERFLQKLEGVVEAIAQAAEGDSAATRQADTRNLAPVEEFSTQNLAPAASQVARASREGGRKLGNYTLQSKLGQGAMGAVYKAHQESMDRTVAIKVLPRNLAQNQEFIARFLREAKAAGKLSHPNIVTGIDTGFADGYYYFAMEYVEGRSLGDRLKEGPLEEEDVVRIGMQMTDALDHAHEQNIVHRDVKPENILLALGGKAKLCDLGLARSTGDDMRITQAGLAVGTPYYISPEQARGDEPGPQADIYSLGATLYHLVTGQVPFDGENQMQVMQRHLNDIPRRPTDVRPRGVSKAFEAVIMKMMARNPQNRYATMGEVEADLEKVDSGEVPSALRGAMAQRRAGGRRGTRGTRSTRPVAERGDATATTRPLEAAGRFPVKIVALVAAVLVLVGSLIAFFVLRKGKGKDKDKGNGGGTHVVKHDPEADRLLQISKDFESLQAFEKKSPKEYAELVERYTKFMAAASGTKFEVEARDALAAVKKRQESDSSEERLAKLKTDFEAIAAFEKANPEKYGETISKYSTFIGGAAGTDFEARAKAALDETTGRRKKRAEELLAAMRTAIAAEQNRGNFGAALAKVGAFPEAYSPVVAKELEALEKSVRAAGKAKWHGLLSDARELLGKKKFAGAKKKVEEGKALGLAEAEAWVSQALVEVEKARLAHEEKIAAEYRAKYKDFKAAFGKLTRAGKFDEALARGKPLVGKLGKDFSGQLAADLAMAADARDLIKGLRKRLKSARKGSFGVMLPMGSARFTGYDAEDDRLSFRFGMGSTSMRTTDFKGEKLVDLARRSAGGKLSSAEAKRAACYLLALGQAKGVAKLIAKASEGGLNVKALESRLSVLKKGATEVEAELAWKALEEKVPAKLSKRDARTLEAGLKTYVAEHGKTRFAAGIEVSVAALRKRITAALERPAAGALTAAWRKIKTAKAPDRRTAIASAMFYDSKRKRCVLIGGAVHSRQNDMWALDVARGAWTCLEKHNPGADGRSSPKPQNDAACAYDPRNDLYVWGTWVYAPGTARWKEAFAGSALVQKHRYAMCYYPPGGKFLGAGMKGSARWIDAGAGTVAGLGKPEVNLSYWLDGGMAWVPSLKRFVAYGGVARYVSKNSPLSDETWTFDPASGKWAVLRTKHRPPARARHKLVWHACAGAVVLFGGRNGKETLTDLWVFDPGKRDWIEIRTKQTPGKPGAACYDSTGNQTVLLTAATAETWVLNLTRAASGW